jgi:hypothetical protein
MGRYRRIPGGTGRRDQSREEHMRMILLAGAVLALSACGGGNGGDTGSNDANNVTADNMALDQNGSMDSMSNMEANGAVDSNTQNMMMKDATTHDADTNLANGI